MAFSGRNVPGDVRAWAELSWEDADGRLPQDDFGRLPPSMMARRCPLVIRIGDSRVLTTLLTALAVWLFVIFTCLATATFPWSPDGPIL